MLRSDTMTFFVAPKDGAPGSDGQTFYTWIKYADTSTGVGISNDPTNKTYIGFAYNKTTPTESNTASDYTWSLIKGAKGDAGVPGAPGANGQTFFTWIKYADTSTGVGISNDPTNKTYIGFAYNKTTPTESNTASDYTWSLIKGAKGDTGVPGAPGSDGQTFYTWIKYSDYADGTNLYDTPNSNTKYIGIAVNKTTATESSVKTDYVWSQFKGDTGATGQNGVPGRPGARFRMTDWAVGVEYFSGLDTNDVFYDVTIYQSEFYLCTKRHTSTSLTPAQCVAQGLDLWEPALNWKFIATDLLMSRLIKADEIEVDNVIADGIFGRDLDVENAILRNLTVNRLGTTANPYANRLANIGSGIGVFRNLDDESSIDNAIIGMGKDVSIMQMSGERKPAFVVRDKQWRGTYSSSTIYYKDDRIYYSSHLGASTWSSATSYNIGTYVTYNNTVWVCTTNNSGYTPYVGSTYWRADGGTYIFTKDWLETDTPSAGYLPTNVSYWLYSGAGNLGGGKYSEIGSEGVFSNGSNIMGFSVATGVISNFSAAYLLQKRNSRPNGVSAAVLGFDQTDDTDGQSKSYGGYFNSAYIGRVVHNIRNVSASGSILKSDYRIHCYGSSSITLSLPVPDNSMVGQTIKIRRLGSAGVTIITSSSYPIWDTSSTLSINFSNDDALSFTWDGNYWVTEFTNQ